MSYVIEGGYAVFQSQSDYINSVIQPGIPIRVLGNPPPVPPGQGPGLFPAEPLYQAQSESEKRARGWSAISNRPPDPKDPVPILYGKQRVKPALINGHVVPLEDGSERLKLLFAIGEGPLYKIAGLTEDVDNLTDLSAIGDRLRLNGQPVTDFEEVKVSVRLGDEDQELVRGFTNLHNEVAVGRELLFGEPDDIDHPPKGFTTTGKDVDAVRLHFTVGELWSQVAGSQEYAAQTVEVRVRYRPHTPSGQPNQEWKDGGLLSVTEDLHSTTRRAHKVEFDTPGWWDLRVVKKTPDSFDGVRATDITWLSVDEIQESTETYPNTGLLAIKVKNTENLSGSTPTVDVLVHGLMVDAPAFDSGLDYDDTYWNDDESEYRAVSGDASQTLTGSRTVQWTRNPVWCLYDLMTNARYGGGLRITAADIHETALNIAAKFCHELVDRYEDEPETQEHRCRLDIIFDSRIKLGDAVKHILKTFRGVSFESGQIIIRVDKAEAPAQIFTGGNTLGGSFSHSWPALSQIHNTVQVSFRNEDDDYEERTVAAETDDGNPEKVRLDYLRGVTRRSQAKRLSRSILLAESRQKVRASYKAATDALSCQAFDVVGLANLVPAWGTSNGAVTEINIGEKWFTMNRDVTLNILPSGEAYYVNTRKGTTSDVVDSLIVASGAGEYPAGTRIYTVTAFDSTTTVGSPVSIGELNVVYKPFRITKINHQADGTTSIEALEYDAAVYSDSGPADEPVNYSTLPIPSKLPAVVTGLTAVNSPGAKNSTVLVSWSRPQPSTARPIPTPEFGPWRNADIYVSPDAGGNYIKYGSSEGDSFQIDGLVPGATYLITVVSVSGFGMTTPLATSPTVEIKVKVGAPPPNVTGLRLRGQGLDSEFVGRDPIFQWKAASGSSAYGLLGPLGGGNLSKDANSRWYQIEIWTSGIRRRQEVVDKTEYVYSFEKNLNDHAGVARRGFEIRVWALDQNNTPSLIPATMAVTNPLSAQPTGFDVTSSISYFFVSWDASPEPDAAGFVLRRSTSSEAWTAPGMVTIQIGPETTLTDLPPSDVVGTAYYYRVAAYDTFDDVNNSDPVAAKAAQDALLATAALSDTIGTIPVTDIDDFGAEKIFMGMPILQGEEWEGNQPATGRAQWNQHFLFFSQSDPGEGVNNKYTIAAGNTPVSDANVTQYIYWLTPPNQWKAATAYVLADVVLYGTHKYTALGASTGDIPPDTPGSWTDNGEIASNDAYAVSTENPGSPPTGDSLFKQAVATGEHSEPGGFIIATNVTGIVTPAWSAVANAAIGSAHIENLAVNNAKIANLAVDDAKIANLAVTNAKIALLAVQNANILDLHGEKITANTILANQLKVGNRAITANGLVFTLDKKDKSGESGIPEIIWTDGTLKYPGGTVASPTTESRPLDASVSPVLWSSGTTLYFYYDTGAAGPSTTIEYTTDIAVAQQDDHLILATYEGGDTLIISIGGTTITGDQITTGSLSADNVDITGTLSAATIIAGRITETDPAAPGVPSYFPPATIEPGTLFCASGQFDFLVYDSLADPVLIEAGTTNVVSVFATTGAPVFEDEYDVPWGKAENSDTMRYSFYLKYSLVDTAQRLDWYIEATTGFGGYIELASGFIDPPALTSPTNKYEGLKLESADISTSVVQPGAREIRFRATLVDVSGVVLGYGRMKYVKIAVQNVLSNIHP